MLLRLVCTTLMGLLFLNHSAAANPSSSIPLDNSPTTMVAVSPVIFSGIVTGMRYGYHDNAKMPYTFVQFSGVKYLRRDAQVGNSSDNTLEISLAGGIRENLRLLEIDELPKFNLGERYLIFLRGGSWRLSPITAFESGVMRLHGRLSDNALVLNYHGQPIERVEENQFILAKEKIADAGPGSLETELDSREVSHLTNLSGTAPKDKLKEQLRTEVSLSAPTPQLRETDNPKGRFALYGPILRMSELQKFIDQAAAKTSGIYPEFSKLSLTPVDVLAGQGMKALSPSSIPATDSNSVRQKNQH